VKKNDPVLSPRWQTDKHILDASFGQWTFNRQDADLA
jgi:hypothetical protein